MTGKVAQLVTIAALLHTSDVQGAPEDNLMTILNAQNRHDIVTPAPPDPVEGEEDADGARRDFLRCSLTNQTDETVDKTVTNQSKVALLDGTRITLKVFDPKPELVAPSMEATVVLSIVLEPNSSFVVRDGWGLGYRACSASFAPALQKN